MRILMLNYEFPPLGGGAGRVSMHLAEELVAKGHQVDVVTMGYDGLEKTEVRNGVRIFRIPCLRSRMEVCHFHEMISFVLFAFFPLLKITKKGEYDIVHCHFLVPTGILAYLLKKFRGLDYVVTIHGSDVPGFNPDRFNFYHSFTKPLLRLIARSGKMIVSPSSFLLNLLRETMAEDVNAVVIPNGVKKCAPKSREKKRRVLLISRLLHRKGFQHFLMAVSGIRHDYDVNIAGEGPYRTELVRLNDELGTGANFLGWVSEEEKGELYETSSIFVLPSYGENSSIALLEAMAAEMAIITTNISGCPETVGKTAILTEPGDVEGLRNAFLKLISDEELVRSMGRSAMERANECFTWEKIADRYVSEVYEEVTATS